MIDDAGQADPAWLDGVRNVGVTAGASAPGHLVSGVLAWLAGHGYHDVELTTVTREDIHFATPPLPERRPADRPGDRSATTRT